MAPIEHYFLGIMVDMWSKNKTWEQINKQNTEKNKQPGKQTNIRRTIPMEEKLLNYATNWLIIMANKCSLSARWSQTNNPNGKMSQWLHIKYQTKD